MSNWVALNIEPDEAVEEEVDDTKEIQIEETLKLYQNALKLHSQGPQFYRQAEEAYNELLNSEIFKYPESISEYRKSTLQDSESRLAELSDAFATAVSATEELGVFDVNDSTSSTLLQTIYLSYKNHGQYLLDSLQALLQGAYKEDDDTTKDSLAKITDRSSAALASFAEALERDDTDLNLWRQSARLSSALNSFRLVRYCLESVLADDENRLEMRGEQLGLEETFAEDRLRETLQTLNDRLSVSQVPLKKPKKALLRFLKRQNDPYPYLPALPENLQDVDSSKSPATLQASPHVIDAAAPTWLAVGKAILQVLIDEEQNTVNVAPGASINIQLPSGNSDSTTATTAEDRPSDESSKAQDNNDQPLEQKDTEVSNEAAAHSPSAEAKPQEPYSTTVKDEDKTHIDQRAEDQLMETLEADKTQQPEATNEAEAANADDLDPKSSAPGCRKRSSASAANEDNTELVRAKSRRTRARESHVEISTQADEVVFDQTRYYEDRLETFIYADKYLFETVGTLLSKLDVRELGSIDDLMQKCSAKDLKNPAESNTNSTAVEDVLLSDLRGILTNWNETYAQAFYKSDDFSTPQDLQGMSKSGLAIFLEHSRKSTRKPGIDEVLSGGEGLFRMQRAINSGWYHLHEVTFCWLKGLLVSEYAQNSVESDVLQEANWPAPNSTYVTLQWPDTLKDTVVQILVREDEYIYRRMCQQVEAVDHRMSDYNAGTFEYTLGHYSQLEMIQTTFELHLDVYARINNPNSEVDQATRVLQWDRLARWSLVARTALTHFINHGPPARCPNSLVLRHLWASTFQSNMETDVQREHVFLCLQDLKHVLNRLENPRVNLINNAAMPELSVGAIDQEISKLNSMDFFLKVFSPESEDPVDLIETIEPILEPSSVEYVEGPLPEESDSGSRESQLREMGSFLDRGDSTLRLFLWRRLLDAYKAIDYPPKVTSCYLRIIETIVKEFSSTSHLEETAEHRQTVQIRWFKLINGVLDKALTLILNEPEKAYECFDMDHLKSSMSAVALLLRLLHSFSLFEDSVRVGQIPRPERRGSLLKSSEAFKEKLREMQVRCWVLQYTLLREAIEQNKGLFKSPLEDRIGFLRAVHNALGVRSMCKYSQKQLPKLMKSELLQLEQKENYEAEIFQVLYDIHGIRLAVDGIDEHDCPVESIDRPTAILMTDLLMRQARKLNIKDLSKSVLKVNIDRVQTALGTTKSSPSLSYNKRIISAYLKSPLNPSVLFQAIRGVVDLPLVSVPTESADFAQNGWYFLLGHAALMKFRSQKRLSPIPTTDLDYAISHFRQDLEHASERWESWYRLAQTYDSKIEEEVTWSADKLNNNRTDILVWQRNAIHCYAMAVSTATQTAEPTQETRELMAELYSDFGIRIYSSSREPFSMGAFSLDDFARHFNNEESQEMYKRPPFKEMSLYSAWKFASYLLKKAITDKPKSWMSRYVLAKCLWKRFNAPDSMRGHHKRVDMDDVLDTLLDAIDMLPQRRDSRSDPIFEPHFKLVSTVDKLVHGDMLTPIEGSKVLQATPWAGKVQSPEDKAGWKSYILEVIRKLKSADKSNWHHRMASRTAHVIYDDQRDATAAAAARNELTQQIFTKTMTIQVWKPEYERPGRHFVFTTRYVYFFVHLLDQLDDRANLDQLLRRVRKRQSDFLNHTKLWEDICLTYSRVIRRAGNINEGHEESVFRPIGWEEFSTNTARLESLPQLAPESPILLELLRDAVELKKLNNNLMKVALLEDLIADLYSRLYEINMPQLMDLANEENKEKMKVDHLLMANDGAADAPTPPSAPTPDAPAPRGRTKGIARRDIQKRAETIVARKLTARAPPTKTTAAGDGESSQPPATTSSAPDPAYERLRGEATEDAGGQQSDAPNSVHDSADDESELSELDDEKLSKLDNDRKAQALMFPNLPRTGSAEPGSEMSVPGSGVEGGEDVEGDGEEEGNLGDNEGETMMEEEGEEVEGETMMDEEGGDEAEDEGEQEQEGEEEGEVEMEDFKAGEEPERAETDDAPKEKGAVDDDEPMEG